MYAIRSYYAPASALLGRKFPDRSHGERDRAAHIAAVLALGDRPGSASSLRLAVDATRSAQVLAASLACVERIPGWGGRLQLVS